MSKNNLIIIILLMLITGILIYYLYLKPENFTVPNTTTAPTNTCVNVPQRQLPVSIISRFFGIGFNIYPANNTSSIALPTNITNTNLYLIEHIPVVHNNTLGSMYAMSGDGQLTIKVRNDQDFSQWWILTPKKDSTSDYFTIMPFTQNTSTKLALQYENGNIALRPYNDPGFESQKWITGTTKITRGIPVLNYNPASMFTPEFDPYSSSTNVSASSLAQQNSQQVADVINTIKANIQQYLNQTSSTQNLQQVSSSSLGNREMPLNINLNLSGRGGSTASAFANIDGNTTKDDILSLLNKYETTTNSTPQINTNDLLTAIRTGGCANIDINDYTSNRVSTCNCKL